MKILFFELFLIFCWGTFAHSIYRNKECQTLNIENKCNRECPCIDGASCSEEGLCIGNISLNKRDSCSSLTAEGKCSSECPCTKAGDCCSEDGKCGSTEKFCRKSPLIPSTGPGVILYLPNYRINSEIDIKTFDFSKVNIINYSFCLFTDQGDAYTGNPNIDFKQDMLNYVNNDLKKKYPHLKIVYTLGGTHGSLNFKNFLSHSSSLERAAKSVVTVVKRYNFDGIDVDWEFPKTEEEAVYLVNFIKKIREYMGYSRILTISASALISRYYGHTAEMEPYLDWFNLMTYHYSGYWDKYSGYNAPLYPPTKDKNHQKNSDYTVKSYLDEGVPANKLVLGASFIGQAWKVESTEEEGYNQVGDANIESEPNNDKMEGFWSYRSLRQQGFLTDKKTTSSDWTRTWHDDVKSPTIINKKTGIYISYDDVDSMCERSKYVKNKKIGGIMAWELGQDYENELLNSLLSCY